MPSISAVLPAYNEEPVIGATARSMVAALERLAPDYEVIVVNDGSRDRTGEVVAALSAENPRVRCVTHPQNRGYGAALATGFSATTKELIFLTDGDKQFDVSELELFLPLLADADLVIGYRAPRMDPFLRLVYAKGWNTLVRLLFGYTARDVDCAFKVFCREVWTSTTVHSTGATFSAEFLIKARRRGFRVRERRATHHPRPAGSPTGARLHVIARALRELLRLRLKLNQDLRDDEAARRLLAERAPVARDTVL